jgi:protein-disulfide isomerase
MSTTPTKRELREQRRAARREAERAQAAREARRRRAWRLAAVTGVAAVAVVIAVAVSASGGPDQPSGAATGGAEAAALFDGIPENDGVLGDPNAPVTLTEYVDLQCPVCAAASKQTLPTIVNDYVRTGKVKLDARTLHFIGPDSTRAAKMAAAAERQGRLWPFLEVFYANQGPENSGYVTDAFLRRVATAAGVNADAAFAGADSQFAQRRLDRANADAQRLGIDSTPTFTVAKGSGAPHVLEADGLDPSSVATALDAELAR